MRCARPTPCDEPHTQLSLGPGVSRGETVQDALVRVPKIGHHGVISDKRVRREAGNHPAPYAATAVIPRWYADVATNDHAACAGCHVFWIVADGIMLQIVGVPVEVHVHPRVGDERLEVVHVDFGGHVMPQHKHPLVDGVNGVQHGAEPRELRTAVLLHDVFMKLALVGDGFAGGVLKSARVPLCAVVAPVVRHARVGVQRNDIQPESVAQNHAPVIVAAVHDPPGNGVVQPQLRVRVETVVVIAQDAVPRHIDGSKQRNKILVNLRVAAVLNAAVIKVVPRVQHQRWIVLLKIQLHCCGRVLCIF